MKTAMKVLLPALAAFLILPATLPAQEEDRSVGSAALEGQHAFESIIQFVKDVQFDEKDVQSVIELWGEFQKVGEEAEFDFDSEDDSSMDLEAVLQYPAYVSWVKQHGLDRETWMRKALRIQLMMAREEYQAQAPEGQAQMQQQMKELEKMREQLGEEVYQQMVESMQMALGSMDSMNKAMLELPPPTDEEEALLVRYQKDLQRVM